MTKWLDIVCISYIVSLGKPGCFSINSVPTKRHLLYIYRVLCNITLIIRPLQYCDSTKPEDRLIYPNQSQVSPKYWSCWRALIIIPICNNVMNVAPTSVAVSLAWNITCVYVLLPLYNRIRRWASSLIFRLFIPLLLCQKPYKHTIHRHINIYLYSTGMCGTSCVLYYIRNLMNMFIFGLKYEGKIRDRYGTPQYKIFNFPSFSVYIEMTIIASLTTLITSDIKLCVASAFHLKPWIAWKRFNNWYHSPYII